MNGAEHSLVFDRGCDNGGASLSALNAGRAKNGDVIGFRPA
jgi:hypothetical protein